MGQKIYQYYDNNPPIEITDPEFTGDITLSGGLYDSSNSIGSSGQILSTTGSGTAWINPNTVNSASAISVGTNLDSTNATRYITFVSGTSGNQIIRVDTDLTYNPATNSFGNIQTGILTSTSLKVTGNSTFDQNINLTGSLSVSTNINLTGSLNVSTNLTLSGAFYDSVNSAGASGQILSTTGSGVAWINTNTVNVATATSIGTNLDSTNINRYLTFVENTSGNNVIRVDSDLVYNPSTNILQVPTLNVTSGVSTFAGITTVTGSTLFSRQLNVSGISTLPTVKLTRVLDRDNTPGSVGAFLRSDGTNVFWDNTPLGTVLPYGPSGMVGVGTTSVDYYIGTVVRGYTIGGYQNSVAYVTAYKTLHTTDTTSNLGAIMSYYAAYTDAASSGRYGYTFDSHSSSTYNASGKDINKLDMVTDSNIAFSTKMNANKTTNTNVVRYRFLRAYVFGDTDPEKFEYSTETPTVASTTWADRNSLVWRQRANSDDKGYFALNTSTGYQLQFATESWSTWSPPSGTLQTSVWGCISTYAGYIYWKTSATNFRKFNSDTTSSTILNVTTPSQQEENYHTGESKGYMVGMYNTTWQSTGGRLDYINDTFTNVSSLNAPAINSSAGCIEFGRFGI